MNNLAVKGLNTCSFNTQVFEPVGTSHQSVEKKKIDIIFYFYWLSAGPSDCEHISFILSLCLISAYIELEIVGGGVCLHPVKTRDCFNVMPVPYIVDKL